MNQLRVNLISMKAKEVELVLFQEQIYYKFVKRSSSKKQVIAITKLMDIVYLMPKAASRNRCNSLLMFIQYKLSQHSRNLHYTDVQRIDLNYNDQEVIDVLSKNKSSFYECINHLINHQVLFKLGSYNAYYYIVNPYFIDNMTKSHWNDMVEDIRSSELNRLNEAFGSGGGITPQQIVEPQPAVEP